LGCALAGSREPLTGILLESVAETEGSGRATLIGRPERATRLGAALVNGAAGHALDFDDTHTVMSGHPSAPVVPALLALVESEGARGPDLLAALVAGIELECRVGGEPTSAALERWTGRFLVRDTLFKYHAACYLTHAAIEAAGTLCRRHAVDPDRIRRVELRVDPSVLGVCNVAAPRTGLEGKFSLRATTAMALLGHDTADPGTFTDARMADPALVRLRDRVSVIPVAGTGPTRTTVIVETE